MILEEKCSIALAKFFTKLEKDIHKIIDEYWESDLGYFHLNKISDLITLRKQQYYDILFKYCKIQYDKSRKKTKRIYDRQLKQMSIKSDIEITTLSSLFNPDPAITYNLNNKIFVASHHTMNRVDNLVMDNLSQSYNDGLGIDEAKNRLTVKYNGLKSWEAARIARTEINSAQNDACYDMCNELGCEYIQWWTAEDERVRDGTKGTADHRRLHGKIVRIGTAFSNGLLYPGDREGSISEWINCRCTAIPYIMPLGMMAPPDMVEFTEDDLIPIPKFEMPTLEQALDGSYLTQHHPEFNKFAPSIEEEKLYKQLLKFKKEQGDVPSLIEGNIEELENKMELNNLHNLKIKGELSKAQQKRYEYLYDDVVPSLGNQYPNASDVPKYVYSKEDYLLERHLNLKRTLKVNYDIGSYTPKDNEKLLELLHKKQYKSLTSQFDNGHTLNYNASKSYAEIFFKYKDKWGIPDYHFELGKLTIEAPSEKAMSQSWLHSWNGDITPKYFSIQEEDLIYDLQYKRLINGGLSTEEANELQYLVDKRNFNYLYHWKIDEGSLPYEQNKKLKQLYKKLKDDIEIDSLILEDNIKPIKPKIELEEIKDSKSILKFKGTTVDGRLPDGSKVEDVFTHSYDGFVASQRAAIQDWANTGNYKRYRKFVVDYDADIEKYFEDYLEEIDPYMEIPEERAYNMLKQLKYNTDVLENVCNNQTKKSMMLYRYQNKPHLGTGKVGEIVPLDGFNSTSISKEGAQHYVKESSSKSLVGKWLLEIEAPAGTKGAYIPSQSIDKFKPEMEFLLQRDTKVEILVYDEAKRYARVRVVTEERFINSVSKTEVANVISDAVEDKKVPKLTEDKLIETANELQKLQKELQSVSKKVDDMLLENGDFDESLIDKALDLGKKVEELEEIFKKQGLNVLDYL